MSKNIELFKWTMQSTHGQALMEASDDWAKYTNHILSVLADEVDEIKLSREGLREFCEKFNREMWDAYDALSHPALPKFVVRCEKWSIYFTPSRLKLNDHVELIGKPIIDVVASYEQAKALGFMIAQKSDGDIVTYSTFNFRTISAENVASVQQTVAYAYIAVQTAFKRRPETIKEIGTRQAVTSTPRKNAKKKRRKVKIVRTLYIDMAELTKPSKQSGRNFSCPCWGVAGHWRQLKSGKRVWVHPYRKGKERNNAAIYSAKEYQVPTE